MPIDFRSQKRLLLGVYERELWPAYRRLLRPGMKAFDVGGRDGYSALLIHRRTRAEVISFECDATGAAEMQRVFDRNDSSLRSVCAFVGAPTNPQTTMTLDQAASRYFQPQFIKIDVEGGEADVLRGGPEVLSKPPSLIVEVHGRPQEEECLDILRTANYLVEIVDQARFFREQRPLEHNRWLVCAPQAR